jgi:hypothetical protein
MVIIQVPESIIEPYYLSYEVMQFNTLGAFTGQPVMT